MPRRETFGHSFSFPFSIEELGDLAPLSLVSARIYAGPDKPNQATIEDDSNALGTAIERVTSWSDSTTNTNEKLIGFTAVNDPHPEYDSQGDTHDLYWIVVAYRMSSGAQIQRAVLSMHIYRGVGVTSRFGCTSSHVYAVETGLQYLEIANNITAKIALAERKVLTDLQLLGMTETDRIKLEDALDLVRYKTVVDCCLDASSQANDRWAMNAKSHDETYKALLKDTKIRYDFDENEVIEETEQSNSTVAFFGRM